MDRVLFDAVQQKLTEQWTTQSTARNASDHLLTGLLFDDAGHRMVPAHATKSGVHYRYYVSLPHLHGESRITPVGSVSRVAAMVIEDVIVKSVRRHLIAKAEKPSSIVGQIGDRNAVQGLVVRIDVHGDHLAIRLKSADDEEGCGTTEDHQLSIPWQKQPSRKSRQILLPHGASRSDVRPTRIERRARLVSAISRGRRWLEEIVSGSVTDVQQIAAPTKMQCAPGQHDDLAGFPRTGTCQSSSRRSVAARHRSRTFARRPNRLGPAVRGARIKPQSILDLTAQGFIIKGRS